MKTIRISDYMSRAKHDIDEKLKLIEIVRDAIKQDNDLREKYKIADKFRFVRDKLQSILDMLEQSVPVSMLEGKKAGAKIAADEVFIYVYLYNAQGLQFRTWQNLVTPKVFYEYSVNRPIYSEKNHIESLLRTKTNKAQHAYLTVAVQQSAIIKSLDENSAKDIAGNPVIKVKEGSLRFEKLVAFTHLDHEYILNEMGELVLNR